MASAARDSNFIPTIIGVSSVDLSTPTLVAVNPTTNALLVQTSLAANSSVNVSQINGVTPLMGNGITGTGSLRVTIASDNTAFSVNANAGTNLNTSALALSATQTDRTQKSQITDGTRDGTVKAASTLPVVTDTAIVVTLRESLSTPVTGTFWQATQPVSGTFWQATQPVSIATAPVLVAGTALIGKVGIDQVTANANEVVTKTGSVTAATLSAETTKVIGTVNIAAAQTLATVTTVSTLTNQSQEGGVAISLNAGAVDTGTRRVVQANGAGKTILSTGGSVAGSGNNTLVAAGTNKLKVFAFSLSTVSTTAVTCIFQSGATGTELWRVILQTPASVAGGANLTVSPPAWIFATAAATLLNLNLSAAVTVHWSVSYYDEA